MKMSVRMITSLPTKRISATSYSRNTSKSITTKWRRKPAGIEITSLSPCVFHCQFGAQLVSREPAWRLLGHVLARVGPVDSQHEDLERLEDGDVRHQHEERGDGPERGAGRVEGQTEDDSADPTQQTDDSSQTDHRHEEPGENNTRAHTERTCADTIGTVLVPRAVRFQC